MTYSQTDVNYTRVIGNDWNISSGISLQRSKFSPDVINGEYFRGNVGNYFAYLSSESITTDRPNFPTRGHLFYAQAGIVFGRGAEIEYSDVDGITTDVSAIIDKAPEYYRLMFNFTKYNPLSKKTVLFYTLQSSLAIKSQGFIVDNFYLGGVQQLFRQQVAFVGLNEQQINSSSLASAQLGIQYNFAGSFFIMGRANSALYDFSTETEFWDSDAVENVNGFGLGLGYNLGFLPMELTASYSPEIGRVYTHIKIGFIF
jgi:NTE family protein